MKFLILVLLSVCCSFANAATPLPPGDWCSATGQPLTIPACSVDSGTAPPGRVVRGAVSYPPAPGSRQADLTSFADTFGRGTITGSIVTWPGWAGSNIAIDNIQRTGYVCMEADVPAGSNKNGSFKGVSNYPGSTVKLSIGQTCGGPAFSGACVKDMQPTDGDLLYWRNSAGTAFFCSIPAGHVAYTFTFPVSDPKSCTTQLCRIHVLSR